MSREQDLEMDTHKFWVDYFELKNGRIKVFRRKNVSKSYYARFTFQGESGFVQESLRTTDKQEASSIALEKYLRYEYRQKQGLAVKTKTFQGIADEYIQYLEVQLERREIKRLRYVNHKLITERYFKAYFGESQIADIQKPQIEAYREWRMNYWLSGEGSKKRTNIYERNGKIIRSRIPKTWKGRVPRTSTLNSEETVLRAIFKFAVKRGYIGEKETPTIRTENISWKPRSTFTSSEYMTLLNKGRARIRDAETTMGDREAHQRFMVYRYVLIAANCGARVTELMKLRWNDILWDDKDSDGNRNIIFYVSGKVKKPRSLVANDECRQHLLEIKAQMHKMAKKHDFRFDDKKGYVFCDYRGERVGSYKKCFNSWLEAAKVARDEDGNKRCLGSLRIFYATQRLKNGVDIYDLAVQMGTSLQMIEKTYSRVIAQMRAGQIKRRLVRGRREKGD